MREEAARAARAAEDAAGPRETAMTPEVRATDRSGQVGHAFPVHVWVDFSGTGTDRKPGVLIDWRQRTGQWQALVTWVEGGGIRAPHAHTSWVAANHLTPRN
jgi:hypothetical protein